MLFSIYYIVFLRFVSTYTYFFLKIWLLIFYYTIDIILPYIFSLSCICHLPYIPASPILLSPPPGFLFVSLLITLCTIHTGNTVRTTKIASVKYYLEIHCITAVIFRLICGSKYLLLKTSLDEHKGKSVLMFVGGRTGRLENLAGIKVTMR